MTTSTPDAAGCLTRVRADEDGRLSAQCLLCGRTFAAVDGHDVAAGLAALDRLHPGEPGAAHRDEVPPGWRRADAGTVLA